MRITRTKRLPRPVSDMRKLVILYRLLDIKSCEPALRYWLLRQDSIVAVEKWKANGVAAYYAWCL